MILPLSLREIDISEVENYVLSGYDYNYTYARIFEDEKFKIVFLASDDSGEIIPSRMILKNKKSNIYYIANKPIWDAGLSIDGKYLFVSWKEYLANNEGKEDISQSQKFAKFIKMPLEKIQKHYWGSNNSCGFCPIVTTLARISLTSMHIEQLPYFGGEEINISENEVIFTQYAAANRIEYCWWEVGHESCKNLEIPTITLHVNTLNKIKTSTVGEMGSIHDIREEFKVIFKNNEAKEIIDFLKKQ